MGVEKSLKDFTTQTAKDYDIPVKTVSKIYAQSASHKIFYEKLEEFTKERYLIVEGIIDEILEEEKS